MHLTEREQERLLITLAADVAQRRRDRGLRLNHPEAVLTREDVMAGVPELIDTVQVEATFPDGTKLVTLHRPIP